MTPQGNMNPLFSEVDIVPDEDLNTKLKFHVSLYNFHVRILDLRIVLTEFVNRKHNTWKLCKDKIKPLNFKCETIVEDLEEHLTTLFSEDPEPADIKEQVGLSF